MSSAGDLTRQRKLRALPTAPATIVSHSWDTRSSGDRTERLIKGGTCCDPLYDPPPPAPMIVQVDEGDGYLDVFFSGSRFLATRFYTVKITPDVSGEIVPDVVGTVSPIRVTGLINGNTYKVVVHATNEIGMSLGSEPHVGKRPKTRPEPPGLSVTAGNGKISVRLVPPANNGGMQILYYTVKQYRVSGEFVRDLSSTALAVDVPVENGTSWRFAAVATNAVGDSDRSGMSSPVMAYTNPDAPTVSIVPKSDALDVTLTFGYNGGSPFTKYVWWYGISGEEPSMETEVVYNSPSVTFSIREVSIGRHYIVYAKVETVVGESTVASASALPANRPGPPSFVVYGIDKALTVEFTPGPDGGSPILRYLYSLNGGPYRQATGIISPLVIPDLSNGLTYTLALKAVNAVGESVPTATYIGTPQTRGASVLTRITQTGVDLLWSAPPGVTSVQYLVVGGGGGGGSAAGTGSGGGGGGGSVKEGTFTTTPETAYTCRVGAGGAGGIKLGNIMMNGNLGESSHFGLIESAGGGLGFESRNKNEFGVYCKGGKGQNGDASTTGGSGGGHRENNTDGGPAAGVGGGGGGGGGAGGAGLDGYDHTSSEQVTAKGGAGGPGILSSIFGGTYGVGGKGGDEDFSNKIGAAGAANTGNGGEGAQATSWGNSSVAGGAGGSGVIILSYTIPPQ